jgi:hypothetical protein
MQDAGSRIPDGSTQFEKFADPVSRMRYRYLSFRELEALPCFFTAWFLTLHSPWITLQ